jgi:hypothetical protein
MHIVGTDLCRRLDTEVGIISGETSILNKAQFCSWRLILLSCFAFEPNTPGGSFACCFMYIWRFWCFDEYERYTNSIVQACLIVPTISFVSFNIA